MADAHLDDIVRTHSDDRLALVEDIALYRSENAADGHQRGRFARAVASDETDDLSLFHFNGDPFEGAYVSVVGFNVIQFKQHQRLLCPNMPQ